MERDQNSDHFLASVHPPLGEFVLDEGLSVYDAPRPRRPRIGPLFISVLLHAFLLLCVFSLRVEPKTRVGLAITPIRLQLLPLQPRQESVEEEPGLAATVAEPAVPESMEPAPSSRQVEIPRAPTPLPPPELVIPQPDLNRLNPTTLNIRQVVEHMRREEQESAVFNVCTEVQKRNPMLNCDDNVDTPFDNLDLVLDDKFQFVGSAANSSSASAEKMQRTARSLRNSGMSDEVIDQYLRDLDMSTRDSATSGDTRAAALKDQMFQNDSTYQLMKRVLNP